MKRNSRRLFTGKGFVDFVYLCLWCDDVLIFWGFLLISDLVSEGWRKSQGFSSTCGTLRMLWQTGSGTMWRSIYLGLRRWMITDIRWKFSLRSESRNTLKHLISKWWFDVIGYGTCKFVVKDIGRLFEASKSYNLLELESLLLWLLFSFFSFVAGGIMLRL